jgi:hypothetical protein
MTSWRRKASLAVHAAHADNVLRGFSNISSFADGGKVKAQVPRNIHEYYELTNTEVLNWSVGNNTTEL